MGFDGGNKWLDELAALSRRAEAAEQRAAAAEAALAQAREELAERDAAILRWKRAIEANSREWSQEGQKRVQEAGLALYDLVQEDGSWIAPPDSGLAMELAALRRVKEWLEIYINGNCSWGDVAAALDAAGEVGDAGL